MTRADVDIELRRHILNRLTFGATGDSMAAADGMSPGDLIDQLLAAEPQDAPAPPLGSDDDYDRVTTWWWDLLRSPTAGLHERMVWFWHGHLTSSLDKASPALMVRQNMLLRDHALGNFREMLQRITVDAAMLYWLDGAVSSVDNPNENYAREVMELFALGRNAGYTEQDVHNAAIALAGWWVDGDNDDEVRFDDEQAIPTVTVLGKRVSSASEVIDVICDHPSCAAHVAGRLYWYFHGVEPTDDVRRELAAVFAEGGLEIRPLLEATLRHPSFLEHARNRPRMALEWYIATSHLYRREDPEWWPLSGLGHVPFGPPNVAGWPGHDRWLSVGAEFNKAQTSLDLVWDAPFPETDDPLAEYLARSALEVSAETRAVLNEAFVNNEEEWEPFRTLLALVPLCPEFNVG